MSVTLPVAGSSAYCELRPSKIIALGLNYLDHIEETRSEVPKEPILFAKTPNVLIGPGESIIIPSFLYESGFDDVVVHYEAELAFVMAERASRVGEEAAMDLVLGFTCFNDVSQRNLQFGDASGWFRGKSLDTFGPVGPVIVPAGELGRDPHDLRIACRLNGETVQESSTSKMLFGIPRMISFISRQITLEPGDIVATGTPSGVGRIRNGDTVEIEIEGIGVLTNTVVEEHR
ncbi:fumarylacetoacetate hydrolase family protein [Candidatus Fermentibacterales bacterium]|nr:fumarylacetoacetate hydrolase family protein [Candidatus Fermentibacterales bacterium]